jgi:retron-type reverse transcriptase
MAGKIMNSPWQMSYLLDLQGCYVVNYPYVHRGNKIHPERTLRTAFSQVAANHGAAGVDHVTVTMFKDRLEENLKTLSEDLQSGRYRPQQIRRHSIPKPGSKEMRPLGIPICRAYCTSFQGD